MADNTNPVPDAGTGAPVEPQSLTPSAGGVAQTTPTIPSSDADTAAKLAKYEQDISRIKSTFQRRETEYQKQLAEAQQNFQAELDRTRRSLLDEEGLKEYEKEYTASQLQTYQKQLTEAQSALDEERNLRQAIFAFSSNGVPMDVLLEAADEGGINVVSQKAWDWLMADRQRLMQQSSAGQPPVNSSVPQPPPPAPPVAPQVSGVPSTGTTWEALVKKYGSEEIVYNLVESGRLSPDVLPRPKE